MANYNLTQTGDEVQAYIDSIPVIDVTGMLSGSNIVFATNPYTQIATNYASDCGSVVRLTVGTKIYIVRITGYDGTNYTGSVKDGDDFVSLTIGSSAASGSITSPSFSTGEALSDVGIDATPTLLSDNLVKSGGVYDDTQVATESFFTGGAKGLYIATSGTITTASDNNYIILRKPVKNGDKVRIQCKVKSSWSASTAQSKAIRIGLGNVATSAGNVISLIEDHTLSLSESYDAHFSVNSDGFIYVGVNTNNMTQAPVLTSYEPVVEIVAKHDNIWDDNEASVSTTDSNALTATAASGVYTFERIAATAGKNAYLILPNLVNGATYHLRFKLAWNNGQSFFVYLSNGTTNSSYGFYSTKGTQYGEIVFIADANTKSLRFNGNNFYSNGDKAIVSEVQLWKDIDVDVLSEQVTTLENNVTELNADLTESNFTDDRRFRWWDVTSRTRGGSSMTKVLLNSDGTITSQSSTAYYIYKFPVKVGDVVSFRANCTTSRVLRIGFGAAEPAVGVTMSEVISLTPRLVNGVYVYHALATSNYNGWVAIYRYNDGWSGVNMEVSNETIYDDQDERGSFDDNFFQLTHKYRDQNVDRWNLLFFSDIHADANSVVCLRNILNFGNTHKFYINDVLHGGDLTPNAYSDDNKLWASVNYIDTMLNTIGNHDAANLVDGVLVYDVPDVDVYNRFFAPYIANWGVVQPANAATLGKCYYYKDYAGAKIRLIVLDNMCDDMDTQKTWLDSVLADARTNNLSVICCEHYSRQITKIKCGFSDVLRNPTSSSVFAPNVQTFINNGGMFVCWLSGHSHHDNFGYMTAYPDQLVFAHTVSGVVNETNSPTTAATILYTKSAAAYTIVSVDTQYHILTLWRLGRQHDQWLRQQRILVYDYANKEILGES